MTHAENPRSARQLIRGGPYALTLNDSLPRLKIRARGPDGARSCLAILIEALRRLQDQVRELDAKISARAKSDETAHRLMSVPVVGPLIATALEALAPSAETFRSGRDFAAWIGLTPIQRSTGGRSALHEHRVCARVHVPAFASAAYLFSGHRAKRPRADGGGKGQ